MMKPGDHRQNVSMEKLRPGRRGASRVLFLFPSNELQHPVGKTARFLAGAAPSPAASLLWEFKPPCVHSVQDVEPWRGSGAAIYHHYNCCVVGGANTK